MTTEWANPPTGDLPLDTLQAQICIYQESILLKINCEDHIQVRYITQESLSDIFSGDHAYWTGILPDNALWHTSGTGFKEVALWRPPKVWNVALQLEYNQQPRMMKLPMPGLIFICQESEPPRVFAAKKRPKSRTDTLYHAPLYNVFKNGKSCPGSHRYPQILEQIPESFFEARFSKTGDSRNRSRKHTDNLMNLWNEIENKARFPLKDLVKYGAVEQAMEPPRGTWDL